MTALDLVEQNRLTHLVGLVDGALDYFAIAGKALAEIRDSRLYRETHDTFEGFCNEQWTMTRRRADQLIEAAEVMRTIVLTSPMGDTPLPANEGQARALAAAPEADRADVMVTVTAKGKLTAAAITAEVEARRPAPAAPPEPEPDADTCTSCGDDGPSVTGGWCNACWEASQPEPAKPTPSPRPLRPVEDEDEQRRRLDTAAMCRGLASIASGLEVEGHAEHLATNWDPAEAERTLVRQMRWVANPAGMRRVADLLCDFADLWEQTTNEEKTG